MNVLKRLMTITAIVLALQTIAYFGIQKFEGEAHNVKSRLDEKIPHCPPFILIYILWYPLIAVFPVLLYSYSAGHYAAYMMMVILDIAISTIVYLAYPTSFDRPVPKDGFWGRVMRIVYRCDYKGKNCMPSMHCSMCFIIMISVLSCGEMDSWFQWAICILSIMIVCSTVLTKQHVVIDVAAALLLAVLCYMISLQMDCTMLLKVFGLVKT